MQIKFCGAAGTVTGSSHLLTLDSGQKILLDCGLYQGNEEAYEDFNNKWVFDPKSIDVLILSHAHIDHIGRVPKLVKDGYAAPIYCTPATRSLAQIMLMDSALIQEVETEKINRRKALHEAQLKPLYTTKDVEFAMQQFVTINYEKWFSLLNGVDLYFADAGHILGSASITLKINQNGNETIFGFSGDIGRPNRPIIKDPVPIQAVDFLIMESTYGDKLHHDLAIDRDHFLDIIIETCIKNKGKLMIPAFSVGRTQEIAYLLNELYNSGKLPKIPVYIDSPLAINATDIFMLHSECFDESTNKILLYDEDPFGFYGLQYTKSVEASKAITRSNEPCIIISSSGMMTAGRIRHHIANEIENPKNTLLIIGFCAPGTLGRRLIDGAKTIRIKGEERQVKAKVKIMNSFSAHADQQEMVDFLANQDTERLKKIYLVHGEPDRQLPFVEKLESLGFQEVMMPRLFEVDTI